MDNKYILTSSGELYHYGVLGMKWGIRRYQKRNGSLTAAGKKRYKDTDSAGNDSPEKDLANRITTVYKNSSGYLDAEQSVSKMREIDDVYKNDSGIKAAKQKLLDADKLGEEFFSMDDDEILRYKRQACKVMNKKWGWGMTDEEIDNDSSKWMLYDDWDQGDDNSFQMFLRDRGIEPEDYARNYENARKEYRVACESATEKLLASYGDTVLRESRYLNTTVRSLTLDALAELVGQEQDERNMYGWLNVY